MSAMASADNNDGIDYVSRMPCDVLLHICSFLDDEYDVQHFANTCTTLRATISLMYKSKKTTDTFNIRHWPSVRHARGVRELLNLTKESCRRIHEITSAKRSHRLHDCGVKIMAFVTSTKHQHYPVRMVNHPNYLLYLFNTTPFTSLQQLSLTDVDIIDTTGFQALTKLRSLSLKGVELQEASLVLPKGCDIYMEHTYISLEFAKHASCVRIKNVTRGETDLVFLEHVPQIHIMCNHPVTLDSFKNIRILSVCIRGQHSVTVPPLEHLERLTLECDGVELSENLPRLQSLEIKHAAIDVIPTYPRLSTLTVTNGRTLSLINVSPMLTTVNIRSSPKFVHLSCLSGVTNVSIFTRDVDFYLENTHDIEYLNISNSENIFDITSMPQLLRHSLLELNVANTSIQEINHYNQLKELDITGTGSDFSLTGLDTLEVLIASCTMLKDVSHLKKLRKLDISHTAHYTDTRGLEHLEELQAYNSRVNTVDTLGGLKILNIKHTRVSNVMSVLGVPDVQISCCMHPSGDVRKTGGVTRPCACPWR